MTNTNTARTIFLTPERLLALQLACVFRFDKSSAYYSASDKGGIFAGVHIVYGPRGLRIESMDRCALFSVLLPLTDAEHPDEMSDTVDVVLDAAALSVNVRDPHAFLTIGGDHWTYERIKGEPVTGGYLEGRYPCLASAIRRWEDKGENTLKSDAERGLIAPWAFERLAKASKVFAQIARAHRLPDPQFALATCGEGPGQYALIPHGFEASGQWIVRFMPSRGGSVLMDCGADAA